MADNGDASPGPSSRNISSVGHHHSSSALSSNEVVVPSRRLPQSSPPQELIQQDHPDSPMPGSLAMPMEVLGFEPPDADIFAYVRLDGDDQQHNNNEVVDRHLCRRAVRHFVNRGRQCERGAHYNSGSAAGPSGNQHAGLHNIVRVSSSPDGFSTVSESFMDEDQNLTDGMSPVSDFLERASLPPQPVEVVDSSGPSGLYNMGAARAPLYCSQDERGRWRGTRGNKRTRTGSSSSESSCEKVGAKRKQRSTNKAQSQSQQSSLIHRLQKLRQNKEFTDVVLLVDGQEIPCHRVVLAACSTYFHALLNSKMKEDREGKVEIQGHRADILELLVRHAYAEPIKVTTHNAQDVVEAADYFQMDTLKNYCEKFLLRQVAEANCLGLMQFASLHSLNVLFRKARKFAVQNFNKVAQQDEFLRLPETTLTRYLSDHSLVVQREEHVFDAAIRWLEFEEGRRQRAAVVLQSVRLFYVSSRFLCDVIANNPILQGNEDAEKIISEAWKLQALGSSEWKQTASANTRPRAASGISEVLVMIGGICNNRRLLYSECYHPQRGWISLCDISTTHSSMHSYSVCSYENNIYITGGHSNSGMTVESVSVYFSNINQWSLLTNMQHPRERHGSAAVDGAVYVAGGLMASPKNRRKPGVLDNVERYRPAYNRWEKVKPLPKRCYSPGVLAYKEKLYVIGGVSMTDEPSSSSKIILDCIQCYDPLKDTWSQLPLGRALARLSCALYRDHFYMISNNASSIFRYDPNSCVLEEWRDLHEPNLEFAGLAIFNGQLVISGGQKGSTTLNYMIMIDLETRRLLREIKMKRSRCMHGCLPIDKYG